MTNLRNSILYLVFLLFPFILQANEIDAHPKVCLNMIVKNERDVIERCLTSVLPIIDYWVIIDTGSTDGTQQTITDFMKSKGLPGELHERPWVDFSHNRNEALKLAQDKGEYVFFIDADEYLVYDQDFKLPKLDKDFYYVTISHSGTHYVRTQLINNRLNWRYTGVLHEVIVSPEAKTYETLEHVVNMYTTEGARSKDPQKYLKDAQVLEKALKDEPNNSRYVFYLAQSYQDAQNYPLALQNYEKRANMGGWDQEVFWSLLKVGQQQEALHFPLDIVINSYNKAFQFRSSRIEPLYYIARAYRINGDFKKAYETAKIGQSLPFSKDILFVQTWMYDYGLPLELSICAYWIGLYKECQKISLDLLKKNDLPPDIRKCVEDNLGFANAKLVDQICSQSTSKTTQP